MTPALHHSTHMFIWNGNPNKIILMGSHVLQTPLINLRMFLLFASCTSTPSNCDDRWRCGNISIPFPPFGSDFWLTCCNRSGFDRPMLFVRENLPSVELTDVSPDGKIKILRNIAHDCHGLIEVGSLVLLPICCWLHELFQTRANKKKKEKFSRRTGDLLLHQRPNEGKIVGKTFDQITHGTSLIFHLLQQNLRILMMVMILPIFSSSMSTPSEYNSPKENPNCDRYCGSIYIPFPFGKTPDCYQSPNFFVTCNKTASDPPNLFLQNTTIGITEISDDGQIKVLQNILYNCYDRNGTAEDGGTLMTLSDDHFILSSTLNSFVAVGCKTSGNHTGCSVTCYGKLADWIPRSIVQSDEFCSGYACCRSALADDVKKMKIDLESYSNNSTLRGLNCSYLFLGEETAAFNIQRRSIENLKNVTKLPMVVNWVAGDGSCEEVKLNSSAYACKSRHSKCYMPENSNGYRCRCRDGYKGNPYLRHGCSQARLSKTTMCLVIGVGSLLLLSTGFWSYKLFKKSASKKEKQKFFKRNGGLRLQQQIKDGTIGIIQFFTVRELDKATDRFNESRILGQGGQGTVYKGMLSDGQIVAIKKSKQVNKNQVEQFINEVAILSQINHRNVVKLLGCCLETECPLLVYEFVPNGTLSDLIHDPNSEFPLSWDMRLKIAADSAGALAYLHSACSVSIYHRDIKTSNILLDEKYVIKVSDFGTSRSVSVDQTHVTTSLVQGTFGYMDPEYFQSSQFTEKSDVYSFGVVLIELLTGQMAVSKDEDRGLAARFLESMEMDGLDEILDDRVLGEGKMEEVVAVARLAQRCLNLQGRMRPTMKEVATELESVRMSQMPAASSAGAWR